MLCLPIPLWTSDWGAPRTTVGKFASSLLSSTMRWSGTVSRQQQRTVGFGQLKFATWSRLERSSTFKIWAAFMSVGNAPRLFLVDCFIFKALRYQITEAQTTIQELTPKKNVRHSVIWQKAAISSITTGPGGSALSNMEWDKKSMKLAHTLIPRPIKVVAKLY